MFLILVGGVAYLQNLNLQQQAVSIRSINQKLASLQSQPVPTPTRQPTSPATSTPSPAVAASSKEYQFYCESLQNVTQLTSKINPLLSRAGWNATTPTTGADIKVCYPSGDTDIKRALVITGNCPFDALVDSCKKAIVYVDLISNSLKLVAQENTRIHNNVIPVILKWTPAFVTYSFDKGDKSEVDPGGDVPCQEQNISNVFKIEEKTASLDRQEVSIYRTCHYDSCNEFREGLLTCTNAK